MEHTIKAFDSAYPGSMFEKPDGSYVERDDAASLAAALLEIIASGKRSVSDYQDAFEQHQQEIAALKAQRDELLAGLELAAKNLKFCWHPAAWKEDPAGKEILSLIAKHKGAEHG